MLKTALVFAAFAFALAYYGPEMVLNLQTPERSALRRAPETVALAAAPEPSRNDNAGEKTIAADAGGQYSLDLLIGGERAHMLVDTGATMVVISADLADRLGLSVEAGRKWRVHTANGDSVATETVLPSVDLGSIYMKDVPALIAERSAGNVNLLGASFLKRLTSVESRNGLLVLRQ